MGVVEGFKKARRQSGYHASEHHRDLRKLGWLSGSSESLQV